MRSYPSTPSRCAPGLSPPVLNRSSPRRVPRQMPLSGHLRMVRHEVAGSGTSRSTVVRYPDEPALTNYWAKRRGRSQPPLDRSALRLLRQQHGRCVLCGSAPARTTGTTQSRRMATVAPHHPKGDHQATHPRQQAGLAGHHPSRAHRLPTPHCRRRQQVTGIFTHLRRLGLA